MTAQESLAKACLAIYALLTPPVLYVAFRHGFRGAAILGWGYLFLFCSLKLVGNGMQLSDPASTGAVIVSSVGLSPLLLATAGVLHEARHYRYSLARNPEKAKRDTIFTLLFHMLAMGGVALMAIGASKLINLQSQPAGPTTAEDLANARHLASGGIALLLVAWLALAAATMVSILYSDGVVVSGEKAVSDGMGLVLGVVGTLPFLGIRVLASFVYYVGNVSDLSPVGGNVGLVAGLEIAQEMIVTVILVAAGIMTQNIARGSSTQRSNGGR
ncbi:hypothetical protein GQ53DRAFT_750721 [Thozetella sp. PMI_491]|nr:hypothetical protein GQ53DRAFT_750721 [Thozetella sp. PMI_491]